MARLSRPALLLAIFGYWLPWLTHPAAALRLNAYELSEWATFLPGVRDGTLSLSRLAFLLPLAGLALLTALAANRPAPRPVWPLAAGAPRPARARRSLLASFLPTVHGLAGWALLLLALGCAFVLFPPYPYLLTAVGDPEYRLQLAVAVVTLLAVVLALYLPRDVNAVLQAALALAALLTAIPPLLAVRPAAEAVLGRAWPLGWGWPLLLAALAVLALSGVARLFEPRP
jgi:hypothetical protein